MPCEEALRAFAAALHGYLSVNAGRAVAIASLTGQKHIRVSLRAIRRFHEPTQNYLLFNDAFKELLKNPSWIGRLGWRLEEVDGEVYIVMPLSTLKKLLKAKDVERLVSMLKDAGACRST